MIHDVSKPVEGEREFSERNSRARLREGAAVRFLGLAITAQQFCTEAIGKNLLARDGISKTTL
jgi:hypothetical protein